VSAVNNEISAAKEHMSGSHTFHDLCSSSAF
jgi:hypothetical protein